MLKQTHSLLGICIFVFSIHFASSAVASDNCQSLLDFKSQRLHSTDTIDFCKQFSGKTLLVVNTASECGYTPQFRQLESLYKKYKDRGFEIVGFPSNSFKQELDNEKDTAAVCYKNYGVSFTMVSHSEVKGTQQNTFFKALAAKTGKQPQWNFNKYLISADLTTIEHFESRVEPLNSRLEQSIKRQLE